MRSIEILKDKLADGFEFLHAKRQAALWRTVEALARGGRLWLTALGRDMRGPAQEKHRIKAVDRLLGNPAIHAGLPRLNRALAHFLLRRIARPVLLVDWTGCGPDQYLLRVGLPFKGRSILLHGVVVEHAELASPAVHATFLKDLAAILPTSCRPIVVTDAGFFYHWFAQVTDLGWDFVGRIRGNYHLRVHGQKMAIRQVYELATRRPIDLGVGEVGANRRIPRRLVLSGKPKQRQKPRKRLTRRGKKRRSHADRNYSRASKEPQLLATSLRCSAKEVVAIYATRMQIEESFRDLKSHRFGWDFSSARSKQHNRLETLLMIATLATIAVLMIGTAAEDRKLERQFQANTVRKRRVLSLFSLGRRVVNAGIELTTHELCNALANIALSLRSEPAK